MVFVVSGFTSASSQFAQKPGKKIISYHWWCRVKILKNTSSLSCFADDLTLFIKDGVFSELLSLFQTYLIIVVSLRSPVCLTWTVYLSYWQKNHYLSCRFLSKWKRTTFISKHVDFPVALQRLPVTETVIKSFIIQCCCRVICLHLCGTVLLTREGVRLEWEIYLPEKSFSSVILMKAAEKKYIKLTLFPVVLCRGRAASFPSFSINGHQDWERRSFGSFASAPCSLTKTFYDLVEQNGSSSKVIYCSHLQGKQGWLSVST